MVEAGGLADTSHRPGRDQIQIAYDHLSFSRRARFGQVPQLGAGGLDTEASKGCASWTGVICSEIDLVAQLGEVSQQSVYLLYSIVCAAERLMPGRLVCDARSKSPELLSTLRSCRRCL